MATTEKAKFYLGNLCATPGALNVLAKSKQSAAPFLSRHMAGDWGEVCDSDKRANETAIKNRERILSAYRTDAGDRLWVITEADRSFTTIMLSEEY